MIALRLALTIGVVASTALSAPLTHKPAYPLFGNDAGDSFGFSVSGAGDVNADGYDDFIVGAYDDDDTGPGAGTARVYSGSDGSVLYTFKGVAANDRFGFSVSGAGDVNNDGYADVIVGMSVADLGVIDAGSARVFSGKTGAILYTVNGDSTDDYFGSCVSGAGDVNNDGYDDFIVGAPSDDNTGNNSGSIRVFSGFNGAVLYNRNGDSANDEFGFSVSGAGDVNNDGFDDFIVGAVYDDNTGVDSGSARVFSGFNGSILYTFNGDSAGDAMGISVSGAGDVNGDGFADLIAGAYEDDNNRSGSGSARVFSGANGSILYTFNGDAAGDGMGTCVSGAGDVNNDGFDDLVVGAPFTRPGSVMLGSIRVFSGVNGAILYTFNGERNMDFFGYSVSGAGDVNNDGYADFIVGAYFDNINGAISGSARVYYSVPPLPAPCPGDANADSIVNFDDINAVIANWLNTCP